MAGDAEPKRRHVNRDGKDKVVLLRKISQAVLWTKYTGDKNLYVRIVRIRPKPARLVYKLDPKVKVENGFVHFTTRRLKPGTQYKYYFLEKDGDKFFHSPIGKFWTPIARNRLEKVVFGGTSCTFSLNGDRRLEMTNRTLQQVAKHHKHLHFFLHAGDQLYCDARKREGKVLPPPPLTAPEFHEKYRDAFSQPGLNALHKAFGMYTTWDDHEVFNGWQGDIDELKEKDLQAKKQQPGQGAGPDESDEKKKGRDNTDGYIWALSPERIRQIVDAGKRSFYDHQPIREENRNTTLWRKFRWGRTMELFILDCRSERNVERGEYISPEQEKWLVNGIKKSKAQFKFILNSMPIGYPKRDKRLKISNLTKDAEENAKKRDYRWTHPNVLRQRERILKEVRKRNGVWWLSGDVHYGTIGWVDPDRRRKEKRMGEVLMGPGGQRKVKTKKIRGIHTKKHMTFATRNTNYVVFEVSPHKNRRKSTLNISFYHASARGLKRLHSEMRHYNNHVMKKPN